MATLKELLNAIPDEYKVFEATIARIAADFEDKMGQLSVERVNKMVADLASGARDEATLRSDILKHVVGEDALRERYGANNDQVKRMISGELSVADMAKQAAKAGTGSAGEEAEEEALPGVLAGGQTIRVGNQYYQVYEFPAGSGSYVSYQFNNKAQVVATLGEDFDVRTWTTAQFDTRVLAEADAEEVVGQAGNWAKMTRDLMRDAAVAAGVTDPSLVGEIASNKEMQQIMAQAMLGDWTPEQIKAAQRKTNYWKYQLYPGIRNLYGRTTDPERAWLEYRDQATPLLRQLGYPENAKGNHNGYIQQMLEKKVDIGTFERMAPVFIQAVQNVEFAETLGLWAQRELGRNLGSIEFGDIFNLMQGQAEPELMEVAEKAQLQWVADNQGTKLSQSEIRDLADRTQLSAAEAQRVFSEFNQGILSLGEAALGRYGLDRDEVLSASAGVTAKSGRTVDEIKLLVAKTARENALFDDQKINMYMGFNQQGQPTRPGLQTLAGEGA